MSNTDKKDKTGKPYDPEVVIYDAIVRAKGQQWRRTTPPSPSRHTHITDQF